MRASTAGGANHWLSPTFHTLRLLFPTARFCSGPGQNRTLDSWRMQTLTP